jgi:peptidyl-prolyl cis-trans isomerase SurA
MRTFFIAVFFYSISSLNAQLVIDRIIAIVGKYPVLLSDLENSHIQKQKEEPSANKCKSFEELLYQKLLLAQADRDSVTVTDNEVETELNKRMAYYIQMMGGEEKFEAFYQKRTNVFKDEIRGEVHDQLLAQKMQHKVTGDAKLTPSEVRTFYSSIPYDSLPIINTELQIAQIVKTPPVNESAKKAAREQIQGYRDQVKNGKSMSVIAALYSEDPGSAKQGGRIEFGRGMMVPEFEAVAFRLKNGEVSEIFETPYGFHFIELIARKGEMVDARHILIAPKITMADVYKAKLILDTVQKNIVENKISFEEAARRYSDDKETKQNGGLIVNPNTASTKWENEDISHLDQNLVFLFDKMNVGDVTTPMEYHGHDSKPGYRILTIKTRSDPHKANMKDDYTRLLQMAAFQKQKNNISTWISKKSKATYIKIDPAYYCKLDQIWTINN